MMNEAETVARRWFEEVWNQGQEHVIDELMADDAVFHGLGDEPIRGPGAFRPFYHQFRTAFPDIRIVVAQVINEGDTSVLRCDVTATHSGPGITDRVTGNPVRFGGICIARAKNGKLVEGWNHFDFLSVYQQVGMRLV